MLPTLKKPVLLKIYLIPLISQLADSMAGTIAILYAIELKADILQINLITTISITMTILAEVPLGILSDRFGRKPMLVFIRALMAFSTLMRVFATEPNHLLLAAFFGGMTAADYMPIIVSMISDVAEPDERQEAISTIYLFSGIGMLVSPIICTFLLVLPQITLRNIYQTIFMAQAMIVVYATTKIRETKPKTSEKTNHTFAYSLKNLVKQAEFQRISMSQLLFCFAHNNMITYIQIYAKVNLKFSDAEVASFRVYSNLGTILIRFLSATLLTKVPSKPAYIAFLVMGGMSCVFASFVNSYTPIVLIHVLSGVSYGAGRILSSVLVADISTHENRGITYSILQAFESVGSAVKVFTTPIVEIHGFTPIFLLGGIAGLVAVIPQLPSTAFSKRTSL